MIGIANHGLTKNVKQQKPIVKKCCKVDVRTVYNLNKYIECKNQYKNICKQMRQTYHRMYANKLEQSVKDRK